MQLTVFTVSNTAASLPARKGRATHAVEREFIMPMMNRMLPRTMPPGMPRHRGHTVPGHTLFLHHYRQLTPEPGVVCTCMGELAGCNKQISFLNLLDIHLPTKHLGVTEESDFLGIEMVPVSNAQGAKIGAGKQCFASLTFQKDGVTTARVKSTRSCPPFTTSTARRCRQTCSRSSSGSSPTCRTPRPCLRCAHRCRTCLACGAVLLQLHVNVSVESS